MNYRKAHFFLAVFLTLAAFGYPATIALHSGQFGVDRAGRIAFLLAFAGLAIRCLYRLAESSHLFARLSLLRGKAMSLKEFSDFDDVLEAWTRVEMTKDPKADCITGHVHVAFDELTGRPAIKTESIRRAGQVELPSPRLGKELAEVFAKFSGDRNLTRMALKEPYAYDMTTRYRHSFLSAHELLAAHDLVAPWQASA